MREFRGVWIATYSNIDWPSKPGLTVTEQKAELLGLLDKAAELRLNAVLLQVRTACDAIYPSSFEPWSAYLNGQMGKAPDPLYDPLRFAIDEAHRRGLELHAWFNPYRAGLRSWTNIASSHVIKRQPNLVRRYGKFYWLDPAEQAVQEYTTKVILDVVRRYDLDGVHMDDYFYPYPETNRNGQPIEFPDEGPWKRYVAAGGNLSRSNWRRENVNRLVRKLKGAIKREKGWVTFGISPFGIWRPGHPPQIKGFDAYEGLYADARQWARSEWVDYIAPQLYWANDPPEQSYSALFNWWRAQNPKLPVWPGGAVTRVGKRWPATENVRQVQLSRAGSSPGHIHWNLSSLAANPEKLQEKLRDTVYQEHALVPLNVSAEFLPSPKPNISWNAGAEIVKWSLPEENNDKVVRFWLVQMLRAGKWENDLLPSGTTSLKLNKNSVPDALAISAIDRFRNSSPVAVQSLRQ